MGSKASRRGQSLLYLVFSKTPPFARVTPDKPRDVDVLPRFGKWRCDGRTWKIGRRRGRRDLLARRGVIGVYYRRSIGDLNRMVAHAQQVSNGLLEESHDLLES